MLRRWLLLVDGATPAALSGGLASLARRLAPVTLDVSYTLEWVEHTAGLPGLHVRGISGYETAEVLAPEQREERWVERRRGTLIADALAAGARLGGAASRAAILEGEALGTAITASRLYDALLLPRSAGLRPGPALVRALEALTRAVPLPILAGEPAALAGGGPLIVDEDGSPSAAQALRAVAELAGPLGAHVLVRAAEGARLDAALGYLGDYGVVARPLDPEPPVAEQARRLGAALVALGAHRRGRIAEALLGDPALPAVAALELPLLFRRG